MKWVIASIEQGLCEMRQAHVLLLPPSAPPPPSHLGEMRVYSAFMCIPMFNNCCSHCVCVFFFILNSSKPSESSHTDPRMQLLKTLIYGVVMPIICGVLLSVYLTCQGPCVALQGNILGCKMKLGFR